MRQTTFALGFVIATMTAPATAQEWDCSDPGELPQQGMNYCAALDYQKADRALNAAWPILIERMKEIDALSGDFFADQANAHENLLKAQRAWIDYRDGQCEAEGAQYAGGSIRPLIEATCKADLTRQRTEQLLLMLEEY